MIYLLVSLYNGVAVNANRQLNKTSRKTEKYSKRLSSGKKINSAADDAAGLAISDKMKSQIRGLDMAGKNIQDGISLLQTGDGAMGEVTDMLQRIRELAIYSLNDTNTPEDREKLNYEVQQIKEGIEYIGKSTEFNEMKILRGSGQIVTSSSLDLSSVPMLNNGDIEYVDGNGNIATRNNAWYGYLDFSEINSSNINMLNGRSFIVTCSESCVQTFKFAFYRGSDYPDADGNPAPESTISGVNAWGDTNLVGDKSRQSIEVYVDLDKVSNGNELVKELMNQVNYAWDNDTSGATKPSAKSGEVPIGHANGMSSNGGKLYFFSTGSGPSGQGTDNPHYGTATGNVSGTHQMGAVEASQLNISYPGDLIFHVGANSYQQVGVTLPNVSLPVLGVADTAVDPREKADAAIGEVDGALEYISTFRANFGAVQNRLEHTYEAVSVASENLSDANSRIEDADMAASMSSLVSENIIQNAAMAVMAQSYTRVENITQLLS